MEENTTTNIASPASAIPAISVDWNKILETLKITSNKLLKSFDILLLKIFDKFKTLRQPASDTANIGYSQRQPINPDRKKKLLRIYGAIAIVLILGGTFFLGRISSGKSTTQSFADSRPQGPNIQSTQTINKDFSFPLLDEKGVKVSTIKYKITTADLEDSIIVNGQRATAVKGRTFLVINLEITNNHTQGIQINSKDYIRLQVNGQGDWIAADIHNDPVAVQAISTKITRLGFPINDTDKNLTLQVGEITGTKQFVKLNVERN